MKKNRKLFQYICLCVICCLLSSFPVDATDIADKSVTQGCRTLNAATTLIGQTQLIENCTAALLYEKNSDTLMYAWNADSQVYPASLVKIVTAIIAIEKGNLTDAIVVTDEVLSLIPSDAASCDLVADEIMTLHDLL